MSRLRRPAERSVRRAVLVVLCAQFAVLGLIQAGSDGLTFDEAPDLAVGLTGLVHRDLRMVPEHPPLPLLLSAAPALAAGPDVPKTEAWHENRYFDHTDELIRAQVEAGRLDRVLFLARLVPLTLGLGCGLLLYLLAGRLTDPRGGLFVAGLWLTTPVVLGYSHLDGLDVPFTFTALLLALALERHGRRPTPGCAVAVGAALGAALLTRHTGLVLVPVAAAVAAWQVRSAGRDALRSLAGVLLVPVAVAWLVFRSIDPSGPPQTVARGFEARIAAAVGAAPVMGRVASALPLPLEYRAGLAKLIVDDDPRPAYLLGRSWDGGEPWYFPAAAAVKMPASALVAVAVGGFIWWRRGQHRVQVALVCGCPALALAVVLVAQPLNLGLRYAFPLVALALVLAAPLASAHHRGARWLLALVAIAQVAATVAAQPHSIAWTQPPFRPAYRVVSDGNLDIGQGYSELQAWAAGKDVRSALVLARGLTPIGRPLGAASTLGRGEWVVVSASALTVYQRDELSWLRAYCPVETLAGGSLLVYRFEGSPDRSPGPMRPAGLCREGDRSVRTSS